MDTRTVTAKWINPDGTPAAYAVASFELDPSTYDSDAMILGTVTIPATADAAGVMSVDLFVNDASLQPSAYTVTWPSGRQDPFVLEAGDTPVSLRELLGMTLPGWHPVDDQVIVDIALVSIYDSFANTTVVELGAGLVGFHAAEGVGRPLSDKLNERLSIKDFGAVCDGLSHPLSTIYPTLADARVAYPLAWGLAQEIDAAAAEQCMAVLAGRGGGTCFFPAGQARVNINPATGRALTILPNIVIEGEGGDLSVVKLMGGQPHYHSIFASESFSTGGATPAVDVTGFCMRDLTIDHNKAENPITDGTQVDPPTPRYSIFWRAGTGSRVERVHITNVQARNSIVARQKLYGELRDVRIEHCLLDNIGIQPVDVGGVLTIVDYDYSAIYTECHGAHIRYNTLRAVAPGSGGARTAIEVHGDDHEVTHNEVEGFLVLANVCGGMFYNGINYTTRNMNFSYNIGKRVIYGVRIYVWMLNGLEQIPRLLDCTIDHNSITLDRDAWRTYQDAMVAAGQSIAVTRPTGIRLESGRVTDTTTYYEGVISGLTIRKNSIFFETTSTVDATDDAGAGMYMITTDQTLIHDRWDISENTISGPPSGGIRHSVKSRDVVIAGNTITNAGKSTAIVNQARRSGIELGATHTNLRVNRNRILDDQATHTMQYGIYSSVLGITNGEYQDNTMRVVDGAAILPVNMAANVHADTLLRMRIPYANYTIQASRDVKYGSQIVSETDGAIYTQVTQPSGRLFHRIGDRKTAFKTADYTILVTDEIVISNVTAAIIFTLPDATTMAGRSFQVIRNNTGTVTIACFGAQTINGVATYVIPARYEAPRFLSNGSNWIKV